MRSYRPKPPSGGLCLTKKQNIMKTLKQLQKEVNTVQIFLYGDCNRANWHKETKEGCLYLLKLYEEKYNVQY